MKRLLIIIVALAATFSAEAQKSSLKCTFRGLEKNTRIVVNEARSGRLVPTDTLTLNAKGAINLSRAVADPLMVTLSPANIKGPILHVILLPKEDISLEVDFMPAINLLNITSVKGSENMQLYMKYTNMVAELAVNKQTDHIAERMESLLNAHPNVLMSAFLVTFFEQQFDQYSALYKKIRDALIAQWPENEFVKHIDGRLRSTLTAGMEAPDIEFADPDGNMRRLSDLRGNVVLIDFWASWCRPCRMENPNVVRLYNQYHDRGFEIFSVSLDNSRDAWIKAIKDDKLVWPNHVSDLRGWSSAAGRLYGIQSIPSTVLIDREGKVLARNLRGQELENKLKEIFDKK